MIRNFLVNFTKSTTTVGLLSLAVVFGLFMFVFLSTNLLSYYGVKNLLGKTAAIFRLSPSTLG